MVVLYLVFWGTFILFVSQIGGSDGKAMQETCVWSLGWEGPLEKEMAAHSSILAWKIPWTAEPGRLPSGSQRVGHDWATSLSRLTGLLVRSKDCAKHVIGIILFKPHGGCLPWDWYFYPFYKWENRGLVKFLNSLPTGHWEFQSSSV